MNAGTGRVIPFSATSPTGSATTASSTAQQDGQIETVILRRGATWVLPKGTPEQAQETIEQTALREVREETGLEVKIVTALGKIEYRFAAGEQRIGKSVLFYLMRAIRSDLAQHDHEYEEVRWATLTEADGLLSFDNYRELLKRAAHEWSRIPGPRS